ncbi:hypothetical protein DEM27_08835 [Metarhizobium album]|uniref:Transmembrane anchored protein n=1 Tax=Metarhizobium album TaxID=2182425 RepID=A0A2U2DT49_9HYPH|nr:hypothetical protein [Rhizobium album]PWE56484.1 hypothetical protein DEM27_08835 [Rhizobium album]
MAAHHHSAPQGSGELPLISNAFLYKLTGTIAALALLTAGISVSGRFFGERIALAGHTDSKETISLTIGEDRLTLPANVIRFARQRQNGPAERVDLYLTWPDLTGYEADRRNLFNDVKLSDSLIFLQISQSTMSRDMSGRLEPIYSYLFDNQSRPAADGLTMHRMKPEAGYGDEVFFTAPRSGAADYVVRCILPATPEEATSGDCQRDIHIGNDLSVMYRFSSRHLPDWQHIDAEIQSFVVSHLANPA